MNAGKWSLLAVGVVTLVFVWLLFSEGLFDSRESLDDRATSLDAGVLGRMALLITSKAKSEKVLYTHGAVKLQGGRGCDEAPTHAPQPQDGGVQRTAASDAGVAPQ